jgi:hypothetical protein
MTRFRVLWVIPAVLVAGTASLFGQPGQSGLAFLKLGVSGRGVAMGDALSALVTGAAANYYNPAGLIAPTGAELMFTHKEWIQDTRTEFLGAAVPTGPNNAIGASVSTTTVSDIEVRLQPGPAQGSFTSRDLAVGLSFAHRIAPNLRVGIAGKFLYEKIFVNDATGFAVDFGGIWDSPIDNLTIGGAVANLGSMNALQSEKITLPALLRIGPGYAFPLESPQLQLSAGADYLRIFPEHRSYLNSGAELVFQQLLAVRIGYQFGSDGRGLSTGIGLHYGLLTLDYAFAKLSSDLGDGHTISLAVGL